MPRYGKGEDFAREWLQEHQPSDKVLCGDVSTRYDAPISNAGVAGCLLQPVRGGVFDAIFDCFLSPTPQGSAANRGAIVHWTEAADG